MAYAVFRHEGDMIDYTPASDVAAGDVVVQGSLLGVAKTDIKANTLGALAVEGVFDFVKATGTGTGISVGTAVFWNATNKVATTEMSGNTMIGMCVRTATDNDLWVRVKLSQ